MTLGMAPVAWAVVSSTGLILATNADKGAMEATAKFIQEQPNASAAYGALTVRGLFYLPEA